MNALARATACLLIALGATGASAHAVLQSSDPAAGSTLEASPMQIRLHFNEPVEPAFTAVRLAGPGGTEVATGKASVDQADGRTVVLPLPPLAAGTYKARWSTTGRDGHRMKGEIGFTVKP
jgi:methionine-rich copper-binding protein CopC